MGISHKRFMGWEPKTFYGYNKAGQLVESHVESEWDESEREWMFALEAYRNEFVCPVCGLVKELCRDQSNERKFEAGFDRCFAATAIIREQEKVNSADAVMPQPGALAWDVSLRT